MSHKFEEGKDLIIDAVVDKLRKENKTPQGALCAEFARQFFATVALDDLREWTLDDLSAASHNFWSLIQKRKLGETKIRIYNPETSRDGWRTSHTIIEVICDDMPFLVDTLRIVINRMGLALHLIVHMGGIRLTRGATDEVTSILPRQGNVSADAVTEAPILLEIDRISEPSVIDELMQHLKRALEDNAAVVQDWSSMRERVRQMAGELDNLPASLDRDEISESKAFLDWIEDHHFTFLGVRDYELVQKDGETILQAVADTGLGVLRDTISHSHAFNLSSMAPEAR